MVYDQLLHIKTTDSNEPKKSLGISKAILAAQSEYFLRMFTSQEENNSGEITVTVANNKEVMGLLQLLDFFYKGKLPTADGLQLVQLLLASRKFGGVACANECLEKLLRGGMNLELACSVFHSLPEQDESMAAVRNKAKQYILQKLCSCYRTAESSHISTAVMEFALRDDGLRVSREYEAFTMLLRWLRDKFSRDPAERKEVLKKLLPLIRFTIEGLKVIAGSQKVSPFALACLIESWECFAPRSFMSSWRRLTVTQPRNYVHVMLHLTPADVIAGRFSCKCVLEGREIGLSLRTPYLVVDAPQSEYLVQFLMHGSCGLKEQANRSTEPSEYAFRVKINNATDGTIIMMKKINGEGSSSSGNGGLRSE